MQERKPPLKLTEKSHWLGLGNRFLDLLFPSECGTCSIPLENGRAVCDGCAQNHLQLVPPFCEKCGEGFEGNIEGTFKCPNCSHLKFSFEFARPACFRSEELLHLIHRLKYKREIHFAKDLGKIACGAFSDERLAVALMEKWPLIPVPLHWLREQKRHFNQAAEIARAMAKERDLPLVPALKRTRSTQTQTQLTRVKRLANLKGAFQLTAAGKRHLTSKPGGAILVDDVFTTGSTVDACARVLKKAGYPRIVVITVMRG